MSATAVLLVVVLLACCLPMLWMMMRGNMSDKKGRDKSEPMTPPSGRDDDER